MKYLLSLLIRITLAFIILLFPINIFYLIFLKPTLFASYLIFLPFSVKIINNALLIDNYKLELIPACISTSAYLLLTLLILLTKNITLKKRIYLFILGSLLIFIANLIRIDLLIFLLLKNKANLTETLHLFFWKILSSVYVFLIWIFLVKKLKIKSMPVYSDLKCLYNLTKS